MVLSAIRYTALVHTLHTNSEMTSNNYKNSSQNRSQQRDNMFNVLLTVVYMIIALSVLLTPLKPVHNTLALKMRTPVSLLERCPHFRGCYVEASMELRPEDVSLSFQRVLCTGYNGVGT